VLKRIGSRVPALAAEEIEAFLSLANEPQCAELGSQTRAEGVLGDAVRWAVAIDTAKREHPEALVGYSDTRFAFFLGRISALADALDAQRARRGKKGEAEGGAQSASQAAKACREALISKLRSFAGFREAERRDLAGAIGTAESEDSLAKSLSKLADLAESWLKRKDKASETLAKSAGLAAADVSGARKQAHALAGAAADATMEGGGGPKDSPAVNVAEGRVLFEMREARRLFDEARAKNPLVARLAPGPSTRHVLGRRSGGGQEAKPPEEGPAAEEAPA
jgi:hypothetical protein